MYKLSPKRPRLNYELQSSTIAPMQTQYLREADVRNHGCEFYILQRYYRRTPYDRVIRDRSHRQRNVMNIRHKFQHEKTRRQALIEGTVFPDSARCIQCGICSFNCPIGIDVRQYAWFGQPIQDSHCLTCGECICRCPRGVLSCVPTNLFTHQSQTK